MNFNEYQIEARKTAVYVEAVVTAGERIAYNTLGLVGEAGEVSNRIKKVLRVEGFDGLAPVARDAIYSDARKGIHEELGDVLWYLAMLAAECNMPLEEIAQANLAKLAARHKPKTPA